MKALPWVLAGVVAVGGAVGAGIYFLKGRGSSAIPAPPKQAPVAPPTNGGTNWGAIAQGVGSALPGIVGAVSSFLGS